MAVWSGFEGEIGREDEELDREGDAGRGSFCEEEGEVLLAGGEAGVLFYAWVEATSAQVDRKSDLQNVI